uniref:WSC domain-containing protein n=1 Tax=Macrostomum lignano TaxID=282301 RepID=A0A1I8G5V8_9PLAT
MVVYEQPATLVTASAVKLQGCYVHLNNEDENLKYRISTSESMTIESCQKDCSRYTYRYFGVANKTECYCGDSLRKEQTSNECNYRCPGNLKQICGGSEYMVVYEQPDILPAASAVKLEGCYFHYDDPSSNLRRYKSSNESMTIESCQKDCSVTTDRYFGVISGTHCYCGDLIMSAQLSLKKCPGNPEQICGGFDSMVVYEQLL